MFSDIYGREIIKDNGVQRVTVDLVGKSVEVQRAFIGENGDGDPEKFFWREAVKAESGERLAAHFDGAVRDFLASLAWGENPPPS